MIGYLREQRITLTYDPAAGTHVTETGDLAKEFIENAIRDNGGARPD